jgi:hypothetical protein
MPTVIDGTTYWLVASHLVEDLDGNRVPNASGQAYPLGADPETGTPLQIRELSGGLLSQLQANGESVLKAFLVSAPEGIIELGGKVSEFIAVPDILDLATQAADARTAALAAQGSAAAAQGAASSSADAALTLANRSRLFIDYDDDTGTWPSRPAGHAGRIIWDSQLVEGAPAPPTVAGDSWWGFYGVSA